MPDKRFLVERLPLGRYVLAYDGDGVSLYRLGRPVLRSARNLPHQHPPAARSGAPHDGAAALALPVREAMCSAQRLAASADSFADDIFQALLRAEQGELDGHAAIMVLDGIRRAQHALASGDDGDVRHWIEETLARIDKSSALLAAQEQRAVIAPPPPGPAA